MQRQGPASQTQQLRVNEYIHELDSQKVYHMAVADVVQLILVYTGTCSLSVSFLLSRSRSRSRFALARFLCLSLSFAQSLPVLLCIGFGVSEVYARVSNHSSVRV